MIAMKSGEKPNLENYSVFFETLHTEMIISSYLFHALISRIRKRLNTGIGYLAKTTPGLKPIIACGILIMPTWFLAIINSKLKQQTASGIGMELLHYLYSSLRFIIKQCGLKY